MFARPIQGVRFHNSSPSTPGAEGRCSAERTADRRLRGFANGCTSWPSSYDAHITSHHISTESTLLESKCVHCGGNPNNDLKPDNQVNVPATLPALESRQREWEMVRLTSISDSKSIFFGGTACQKSMRQLTHIITPATPASLANTIFLATVC